MNGFSLGTVFGVPIWVDAGALFVLAFVLLQNGQSGASGLIGGAIIAIGVLLSILVHELGHAVTAGWLRLQPIGIVIHGFGGYTQYRIHPRPGSGLLVSFAGPLAQLLLGAGLLFAPAMVPELQVLATFNIFWALFNLLPIFPMDGGRILAYLLGLAIPMERAYMWAARVAVPLWVLLGGYCIVTQRIFALIIVVTSLMDVVPLAMGRRRAG